MRVTWLGQDNFGKLNFCGSKKYKKSRWHNTIGFFVAIDRFVFSDLKITYTLNR